MVWVDFELFWLDLLILVLFWVDFVFGLSTVEISYGGGSWVVLGCYGGDGGGGLDEVDVGSSFLLLLHGEDESFHLLLVHDEDSMWREKKKRAK